MLEPTPYLPGHDGPAQALVRPACMAAVFRSAAFVSHTQVSPSYTLHCIHAVISANFQTVKASLSSGPASRSCKHQSQRTWRHEQWSSARQQMCVGESSCKVMLRQTLMCSFIVHASMQHVSVPDLLAVLGKA